MPLILAIVFFLIGEAINAFIGYEKGKSDNRRPENEMMEAKGWYEIWGDGWMFKSPCLCPEEVKEESYYRLRLHQNPNKTRDWYMKVSPYHNGVFVLPNKEVWNEYWTRKTGTKNYAYDYPWLEYPDDRNEWGIKEGIE